MIQPRRSWQPFSPPSVRVGWRLPWGLVLGCVGTRGTSVLRSDGCRYFLPCTRDRLDRKPVCRRQHGSLCSAAGNTLEVRSTSCRACQAARPARLLCRTSLLPSCHNQRRSVTWLDRALRGHDCMRLALSYYTSTISLGKDIKSSHSARGPGRPCYRALPMSKTGGSRSPFVRLEGESPGQARLAQSDFSLDGCRVAPGVRSTGVVYQYSMVASAFSVSQSGPPPSRAASMKNSLI